MWLATLTGTPPAKALEEANRKRGGHESLHDRSGGEGTSSSGAIGGPESPKRHGLGFRATTAAETADGGGGGSDGGDPILGEINDELLVLAAGSDAATALAGDRERQRAERRQRRRKRRRLHMEIGSRGEADRNQSADLPAHLLEDVALVGRAYLVLFRNAGVKMSAQGANAIGDIISFLGAFGVHPLVAEQLCGALLNYGLEDANRRRLRDDGVVALIGDVIEAHKDASRVVENAVGALWVCVRGEDW